MYMYNHIDVGSSLYLSHFLYLYLVILSIVVLISLLLHSLIVSCVMFSASLHMAFRYNTGCFCSNFILISRISPFRLMLTYFVFSDDILHHVFI